MEEGFKVNVDREGHDRAQEPLFLDKKTPQGQGCWVEYFDLLTSGFSKRTFQGSQNRTENDGSS